ncbi:putative ribonuclease H-like domain-containing protein, partial [Tanacetum coccineum]
MIRTIFSIISWIISGPGKDSVCSDQEKEDNVNNTNNVNAASTNEVNAVGGKSSIELPNDPNMPALEDYSIFDLSSDNQDVGAEADMKNLDVFMPFSPIPTTRVHKDHLVEQIIGDLNSATQTRRMTKNLEEHMDVNSAFLCGKIEEEVYDNRFREEVDLDFVYQKGQSFDDLYNNFKIVKQEVKGTASSSSQNVAFVSSSNSTNEVNTAYGDLEQIHEDDLEDMDLKWLLALLSMRTRRGSRKQDSRNWNQDSSERTINVEDTSSKATLAIDGAGFDWSYMADDKSLQTWLLWFFQTLRSFDHLQTNCNYHQRERVVSGSNYTRVNYNYSAQKAHPSAQTNMVPRAVLMKNGLRPFNTARPVNTAHPKTTVYSARPMPKAVNTARPNTALVNAVRANQGHPQQEDQGYVGSGCSRHMTGNMSYLSDFKEFEGEYVAFGGGAKEGRITGKGTLKTGKLDFEDVYFVKELLMYSVDMKNIVPKESLTCVVAKATIDESMLWHRRLENLVDKKVKIIRCDNGTEFKNRVMHEFYEKKGIKREFSVARTPQQNGVAEMRNRTLIKAARTMVLVVKPHNKTPYELFRGRTPALSFMRPFGCHVTILNTLDHLGKFDGKSDDGFFVGYSFNSKAFRVYNIRTKKVEENLHVRFLEDKPIISDGSLFDSSLKNASNDKLQPSNDTRKKNDDSEIDNQERLEKINTTLLEDTHADFFGDETEVDMSNISTTYPV